MPTQASPYLGVAEITLFCSQRSKIAPDIFLVTPDKVFAVRPIVIKKEGLNSASW